MKILFKNFRIVDAETDTTGSVLCEGGVIKEVFFDSPPKSLKNMIINGNGRLVLSSGFIDLHTHLRTPGFEQKETLESGLLAAAAGGWTGVVCMANTNPPIDNIELAYALQKRARELGLGALYPALSLTKGMKGEEVTEALYKKNKGIRGVVKILSEDGKDIENDELFTKCFKAAAKAALPVSCHCDIGGETAAVKRALSLGSAAGAHVHIAHVSLAQSAAAVAEAKKAPGGAKISAEVTPHHLALTEGDAIVLGKDTFGKVAPPLRSEADRLAMIAALKDGVIDAIATDHAPHTQADKEAGAPGFIGLESAFSVVHTVLVLQNGFSLSNVSRLMSAAPAKILGLSDCGAVRKGYRADLVVIDPDKRAGFDAEATISRSKNSPFYGRKFYGKILLTLKNGAVIYSS